MPEIQPADREARKRLQAANLNRIVIGMSEVWPIEELLDEHLAAHREAERERIVSRMKAIRDDWHRAMDDQAKFAADYLISDITTTTPPEPRELTAEIVKEMLPANKCHAFCGLPGWALYESPIASIQWDIRANGKLVLMINANSVPLEAIGTDRKLAALIAAFGIGVGVKS